MAGHRRGPDFLGIGAQKAATTWLYENLSRHPQIAFPAGKEIHFWDERAGRAAAEWLDLFPPVGPGTKQGEITPAYAFLGPGTIREIGAAVPDLRLFYSLRNPIDRAWSSALMELRHAEMTIDEASDQWFIDHFNSSGSRRRGDYAACLSHWQAVFPADRLHVILFDDLVARPGETLTRLAEHLRIDADVFRLLPEGELRKPVHAGSGQNLRPTLRRFLTAIYQPRIADLEKLLGRDFSHWLS
jgi:hypothetical protein